MSDSIRVGIIGAGGNTVIRHIPGLQEIDGVEVTAVCNRSVASGQRVADKFGIAKVCASWQEVVNDPDIDAIVIGTWPYVHMAYSCAALAAGKHVMCEARMCMNADEAHRMLAAANARPDLVTQIVPSPFTLKFDETICDLIADGYLGDVLAVDVRGVGRAFVDREGPRSWRQDFDMSGYNTMGMGIWYEAMARWVGHAKRVMAMSQVNVKARPSGDGGQLSVRVPDHIDIVAELERGGQARLQFSAVTGLAANHAEAWIYGSEGTLRLDAANHVLYGGKRGDDELAPIEIAADKIGGWRVEEEFVGAIRGTETIKLTSFAEGVKYMEFTEAVAQSAANGQVVHLPLGVNT